MSAIIELQRIDSPTPGNTSIAFDGESLWVGSIETNRLYSIDPHTGAVRDEFQLPGTVFGIASIGDTLRVMLGEGEGSFRTIYRFEQGSGLTGVGAIQCPDNGTGSHLAYDGERLFIGQRDLGRIVAIDDSGMTGTVIEVPFQLYGISVVGGRFYCVATDAAKGTEDGFLLRVDARNGSPLLGNLASFPFAAHGIAFDGTRFWTNDREAKQIVAFSPPAEL